MAKEHAPEELAKRVFYLTITGICIQICIIYLLNF